MANHDGRGAESAVAADPSTNDGAGATIADAPEVEVVDDAFRLPTEVSPRRYDVRLRPSLDDATFAGEVLVELDVATDVERIVLNAIELEIEEVTLDGTAARWRMEPDAERMVIEPDGPVTAGSATLFVRFTGILNDKLRGFYRSTYVDEAGDQQVIATTQMQATDCRRTFPCWDEPSFKAVFGITLDVDEGLDAISNGPEVDRSSVDGRTVIRFADTMVMSSYLVAMVVGRLETSAEVDVDGIPLRIVHVPGKGHLTDFGARVGAFCLRWFQDYYGIDYPADKVDLVALPDFAAGAMENLGCITFRESLLLVDPERSTQNERQLVADVVAHELAHMWFGDLVTMRWWNGIWLNEAFATFMEIAACDAFAPEWERWTTFGIERSAAFDTDSLATTRPVEFEVRSPDEADGMFDVLTYQKGGALLRMLEQYLGEEEFRRGVSSYLRRHAHANTETNDLWDAIESTSGEPVRRMMDSWIWQPGYPLVSARLVERDGTHALSISQRRFSYPTQDDPASDASAGAGDATAWVVPVHIRHAGATSTVLLDGLDPVVVDLDSPGDVVVVNADGHGFYRVAYDDALRARLADPAALATLSTLERYSLVDDASAATSAGRMTSVELLEFVESFRDEREYVVWQAMLVALGELSRMVEGDALDALRTRVRELVRPALDELGDPSEADSDLVSRLRGLLVRAMGALGADDATRERCRALLREHRDGGSSTDADLLAAATTVVAVSGDEEDYEAMVRGFLEGDTPQDQLRNLYALAEFDDPDLVVRSCEFAMSDAVKSQNAPFLLRAAIANRDHGAVAWRFVEEHWAEANERFPGNTIVRMIDTVRTLTGPGEVEDVHEFFATNPIEQATLTLQQILERQRVNAARRDRDAAQLAEHLTSAR
ncbi:M1 family metallopeptidase [Ilumatobacter sp.]|uniref:M1 family metallopeptidase n=1 Tax=Ilumatobacter sp. TaxID=1967498 RepID=UPI003B51EF43